MNKRQRDKNRNTARLLAARVAKPRPCPSCGRMTSSGHFVLPSFGDPGFYACASFASLKERE